MKSIFLSALSANYVVGSVTLAGVKDFILQEGLSAIIVIVVYNVVKSLAKSKVASGVIGLLIGGLVYYVTKNPDTVLQSIGEVVGKLFTGGSQ